MVLNASRYALILLGLSAVIAATQVHAEPLGKAERQVGPSDSSTSFGLYQVSPESPDASRIAYIRYKQPPTLAQMAQPAELWLCDHNLENHRKVADIGEAYTHNGADVQWLEDDLLVLQTSDGQNPSGGQIRIYHIPSGELAFEPFPASSLGQTHHDGKICFWVWPEHEKLRGRDAGVYEFNYRTGEISLVFSVDRLQELVDTLPEDIFQGKASLPPDQWRIFHVKHSPDGKRLAFRADILSGKSRNQTLCFYDRTSDTFSWFNGLRPNHYFWYDNESVAGHDITPGREPFRRMARFKLNGDWIEDMAAPGVHGAPSPDFTLFASDSRWRERRGVHISRKGETIPRFLSDSTEHFNPVVRQMRFHENPCFFTRRSPRLLPQAAK